MPIDADFNSVRQHDKMLVIQCEDRLITTSNLADTVDDPRLYKDTYIAHDRTFALVEAIEMRGEEPKTIKWSEFDFKADDGTIINKEWLDLQMLR